MTFHKTGAAPVEKVMCSCGGEIDLNTRKCVKCGKEHKLEEKNETKGAGNG
jgi:hypothetical protein